MMVNNSTNINETKHNLSPEISERKKHLSPQNIEHKQTTTCVKCRCSAYMAYIDNLILTLGRGTFVWVTLLMTDLQWLLCAE